MRVGGYSLNIITLNIDSLCGRGKLKLALNLLDKLLKDNYQSTFVSYTILIKAMMIEGGINEATKLPNEMLKRGLKLDTFVYNSIIRKWVGEISLRDTISRLWT